MRLPRHIVRFYPSTLLWRDSLPPLHPETFMPFGFQKFISTWKRKVNVSRLSWTNTEMSTSFSVKGRVSKKLSRIWKPTVKKYQEMPLDMSLWPRLIQDNTSPSAYLVWLERRRHWSKSQDILLVRPLPISLIEN